MNIYYSVVVGLILILLASAASTGFFSKILEVKETPRALEKALVTKVIDGDTIELENGERVRLLGANTPERGEYFYEDAKEWLAGMVEGREVLLESDEEDRDKYGRLLRHVFVVGIHVNLELVSLGYAKTLIIPPSHKYVEEMLQAEESAMEKRIGIWEFIEPNERCIDVHYLSYNPMGNDNEDLNKEYVIFRNFCAYSIDMSGWEIKDEAGNKYAFGNFALESKARFLLHTGSGIDSRSDLYWGKTIAVWNNDGDTLVILDRNGETVLEYAY